MTGRNDRNNETDPSVAPTTAALLRAITGGHAGRGTAAAAPARAVDPSLPAALVGAEPGGGTRSSAGTLRLLPAGLPEDDRVVPVTGPRICHGRSVPRDQAIRASAIPHTVMASSAAASSMSMENPVAFIATQVDCRAAGQLCRRRCSAA